MSKLNKYSALLEPTVDDQWWESVFEYGKALGFENVLMAILPRAGVKLEKALLQSNYDAAWREKYDAQGMAYVDPTVQHSLKHNRFLVWSPETFQTEEQRALYEEASGHGLRSGVTFPIHGPRGQHGMICFVTDRQAGARFDRELAKSLPELALFRDIVTDGALGTLLRQQQQAQPKLTDRELECLKWTAAGKTSWEISVILNCSESAVNFHISNFRQKMECNSRLDAVIKAIRLGLITLE